MAEAALVGGEPEQLLDRVAGPPRLALGRHEQKISARLEHPDHVAEIAPVVPDVLEEVDGRHHVEGGVPEGHIALAGLEHAAAEQQAGRAHVVALEVAGEPAPAPLAQEVGGEPGGAAQLETASAFERGQVVQERLHRQLLLE